MPALPPAFRLCKSRGKTSGPPRFLFSAWKPFDWLPTKPLRIRHPIQPTSPSIIVPPTAAAEPPTPSPITRRLDSAACRLPTGATFCSSPPPPPGTPAKSSALAPCRATSPNTESNVTSPEINPKTTLTYEDLTHHASRITHHVSTISHGLAGDDGGDRSRLAALDGHGHRLHDQHPWVCGYGQLRGNGHQQPRGSGPHDHSNPSGYRSNRVQLLSPQVCHGGEHQFLPRL